ncbi:MAG: hypothetical protein M3Z23_14615 [Acidobacteriota bacterium]|nr:hypothetical protein [Acidobacteriota bacterium]
MNPMTGEYIPLLVPIATFLGTAAIVVLGFSFNNSRITDLRGEFSARFGDLKDLLRAHSDLIQAHSDKHDANLRRVEDVLLGKFAELDNCLSRIENHMHFQ